MKASDEPATDGLANEMVVGLPLCWVNASGTDLTMRNGRDGAILTLSQCQVSFGQWASPTAVCTMLNWSSVLSPQAFSALYTRSSNWTAARSCQTAGSSACGSCALRSQQKADWPAYA